MSAGLGWTLGEYVIGLPIDAGKFGTVYEAKHVPSGRDVALKLIPLQGLDGDEKVAAERHGAMLQSSFSQAHRGLVPEVFEHQQIVSFYAISMELVRGDQLTDVIAAGPMPPRRAAEVAMAICTFLEKAHRFETEIEGVHYGLIVHADLKPDHILLLEGGGIRVLDFGIAKALAERTLVTTNKWGSVHYASPERLQSDGHVNEHADFWSLGVMLFEMVAGFRPYRHYEHNVSRLDAAIRRQETREPLPLTSDPVLAAIVHKLLAPQLERRYASAAAITKDLHAFLHGGPVVAATEQGEAGQDTIRIKPAMSRPPDLPPMPRVAPPTPATEPLRRGARRRLTAAALRQAATAMRVAANATRGGVAATRATSVAGRRRRSWPVALVTRTVRFAGVFLFFGLIASESLGLMRAARFRSQVAALEVADVPSAREEYRSIDSWAPLGMGTTVRLGDRLTGRMIELADRAILGYRTGTAPVAQAQWEQARECLELAAEISPDDSRVAAKQAYVRGHLSRITARDPSSVDAALQAFRDSARLDPDSPDPYLGMARIFAYSMPDVDALEEAVHEAENRGYTVSRREHAQLGDAYKIRADRERSAALRLDGDARSMQMQSAAADYAKCVENFDGLHFYNSEENLRICQRRLAAITPEIDVVGPPEPAEPAAEPEPTAVEEL